MPDLQLAPLLEATRPDRVEPRLAPFLDRDADPPRLSTRRVQAPLCYWAVYRQAERRVTLKSFFAVADYERYAAQLAALYPDRLDQPNHPAGGLLLAPELNGILWGFPFDPAMPALGQCADGTWVAELLHETSNLRTRVVNYNPEVGALLAYSGAEPESPVAFGKVAPRASAGLVYLVMDRLWGSPARQSGALRVARPLAYRPEAGLLLQAPAAGHPIGRERNRALFRDLARHAGAALAALHASDVPFGPERPLEHLLARLRAGLAESTLVAPHLHRTLRQLLDGLEWRASQSRAGPLVPSHGDFKYDQLLYDAQHGHFTLIDFELFCRAEAALDIGTFCAYLPTSSPRDWRDGAAAELLRAEFLRAYEAGSGAPLDLQRVSLYEAGMLAVRCLAQVWGRQRGWYTRASQLLDLAFDRLADPAARAGHVS